MKPLLAYWRTRSLREQYVLAAGGTLILAVLLALYVVAPLNKERARIRAALPELRSEAIAFDAAAAEAQRLKPLASRGSPTQDMRAVLRETAAAMQIDANALVIEPDAPGQARIQLARVPFARFAAWVDALQRGHKLRLNTASIRALPETGMVSIEAQVVAPGAS